LFIFSSLLNYNAWHIFFDNKEFNGVLLFINAAGIINVANEKWQGFELPEQILYVTYYDQTL